MPDLLIPFHKYTNLDFHKNRSLEKFARTQNLRISNQEELGSSMLGLDAGRKKLMYAQNNEGASSLLIVDINHLEICTVKIEYNSIPAGKLPRNKLHHFIKTIYLNLVFKYGFGNLLLPFLNDPDGNQPRKIGIEAKAKKWAALISRLLPGSVIKTNGLKGISPPSKWLL